MKKFQFWFLALFGAAALAVLSCDPEDITPEDPEVTDVDQCDTLVYPTSTGGATVELQNFDIDETILVNAGNTLTLSVEVTRGDSARAQKLRLFQSDCINSIGTEVDLSDQPKGGANGIDLRRTDDTQVRTVEYSVPSSGFSDIYLTIEIDEADDTYTYKQIHLQISGSGIVDEYTDITLGGNSSALPSRLVAAAGQTYLECDAAENIDFIDITYAVQTSGAYTSYICSNPARFLSPIGITKTVTSSDCDDDGTLSVRGGNATYYVATTVDFETATNTSIDSITVSSTDSEYIAVTDTTNVFAFLNEAGKKGLIKVTGIGEGNDDSYGLNDTRGDITISVKIQR